MRYLYRFNESIERDIKNAIDNVLLWLKEDSIITYTLTDSPRNRAVDPYQIAKPLKRVIINIECIDYSNKGGILHSSDIIDEVETIIDFIKVKWGDVKVK
jgi:hypothetical protein